MNKRRIISTAVAATASTLLLACSPQDRADTRTDANRPATGNTTAERAANSTADATRNAGAAVSQTASDATITTKVKSALLADDEVKGLQIDVDTSSQVVTLTGTAQSPSAKQRAEQLAMQVDGVKSVRNNINVSGGQAGGTGSTGSTTGNTSGTTKGTTKGG
jgi:hyperosmotically inducible protein